MKYESLLELLKESEGSHLDFKVQYGTKIDLVHDILCMVNVPGDKERLIVYGVDDKKNVQGLDPASKKQLSDIIDNLRGAKINLVPALQLSDCLCPDGKIVQLLKIQGDAYKPYWLTHDYNSSGKGKTVRAGVVYCRLGDRNVATTESTPERLIEMMFRERFGLNSSPLVRFKTYIRDHSNWKSGYDKHGFFYHYDLFPEFAIRELAPENGSDDVFCPWVLLFPDQRAYKYAYEVCYHTTKLLSYYEVSCDGGRFRTGMPQSKIFDPSGSATQAFFFDRSTVQYDIHEMMRAVNPRVDDRSGRVVFPEFDSIEDAERALTHDYETDMTLYPFYIFDKSIGAYMLVEGGEKREIFLGPSAPQHLHDGRLKKK